MLKAFTSAMLLLFGTMAYAQTSRSTTIYLVTQYNHTISDRTKGNNPWGFGIGGLAFINGTPLLKATAEITGDLYLENDKVLRLNPDGSVPAKDNDVRWMVNLFVGPSIHPTNFLFITAAAGPSLIGSRLLLGIKPSVGFEFGRNKNWTTRFSYIDIGKRDKLSAEDFKSWSISIGFRLH